MKETVTYNFKSEINLEYLNKKEPLRIYLNNYIFTFFLFLKHDIFF